MRAALRRSAHPGASVLGLAVAAALVVGPALAGCGSEQPTGPGGTPTTATSGPASTAGSTAGSLSASPLSPTPSGSAADQADETLTGRIHEGVESGCVVLVDDTGAVVANLIGFDPTGVDVSGTVEVTGSFNPDLMTFCQQGRPFEVTSVRAA